MNKSEEINEIGKALVAFQMEVKDPSRDANNPFFKSKYVTLDNLLQAVRPLLAKHGLSFVQSPSGDGENISVTTLLMHESGQWIESNPFLLKAAKADPQGAGSAVTYGRRYSLSSVLGVAWDDDDDGNNASKNQPFNYIVYEPIGIQHNQLWDEIKEVRIRVGVTQEEVTRFIEKEFNKPIKALNVKEIKQVLEWVKTFEVDK